MEQLLEDEPRLAARGLSFAPPPAHFETSEVHTEPGRRGRLSDHGLCTWLSDAGFDLTGATRVSTHRTVREVTGSEGLQSAASFEVSYHPPHERLVVHRVRVIRDGQAREEARPEAFEILRRELNLERAMFDGRLTAHMIIPDVRIGDIVDTIYSIHGENPALGGRFAARLCFQWATPVGETRVTLRAPADRDLAFRDFGEPVDFDERRDGEAIERRWSRADGSVYRYEPAAPAWVTSHSSVQVADRMSWAEVAEVFRPHYGVEAPLPGDLAARVEAIAAAERHAEGRIAAALRLVQGELRYLAIGLGEGGLRPRPVEAIWSGRHGDCKDAARLLVAVLKRLDVEAAPALVHTQSGRGLDRELPNVSAFNHCLVRVRSEGGVRWIDPSGSVQGGRLESMTRWSYGWALPLVEGAALEWMGDESQVLARDAEIAWTLPKRTDAPADVRVWTAYRGWKADEMRNWVANDGLENFESQQRQNREAQFGALETRERVVVDDDVDANVVTVIETYRALEPYLKADNPREVLFSTFDDIMQPMLNLPESPRRRDDIDLGCPRRFRTVTTINFPSDPKVGGWVRRAGAPGVEARAEVETPTARQQRLTLELAFDGSLVPADRAREYFDLAREMRRYNGLSVVLPRRERGGDWSGFWSWARPALIWALVWAVLIAGARLIQAG